MDRYRYHSLNPNRREFRILEIGPWQPSDHTDLPCCTMRNVSLLDDAVPTYETVSYCWGDPTPTSQLQVDGKILSIPKSAGRCVQLLANATLFRTAWIDAICINQEDISERTHQVTIMGEIYSRSTGNTINLGEEDQTTQQVVGNMRAIAEEIREVTADSCTTLEELIQPNAVWAKAASPLRTPLNVEALSQFFSRPWFRRAWVIQEVILAPQNSCFVGKYQIPFAHVLSTAAWLYQYHSFHIPRALYDITGLANATTLWDLRNSSEKLKSPPGVLIMALNLDATDVRDKVFGMLGIVQLPATGIPDLLRPDYTKDLSAVIRDAVRFSLLYSTSRHVLRYLSHRDAEVVGANGFPSWVSRFDRHRNAQDPATIALPYGSPAISDDPVKQDLIADTSDANVLLLRGVILDVTTTAWEVFGEEDASSFWHMLFAMIDKRPSCKERFLRTITADVNFEHGRATDRDLERFDKWRAYVQSGPGHVLGGVEEVSTTSKGMDDDVRDATYFNQALRNAIKHRRFSFTKADNMALVPKVSRVGDVFVYMHGHAVPYVLRPCEGDEYLMLGECYLENNMDGQVLLGPTTEKPVERIFRIR